MKLTVKRSVLTRHEFQKTDDFTYFQYGRDNDPHRVGYYMPRTEWISLGSPDVVTIMIRAGVHTTDGILDEGRWETSEDDKGEGAFAE